MTTRFNTTFFVCLISVLGGASLSGAQVTTHPLLSTSNFPATSFFDVFTQVVDGPSAGSDFDTDFSIESTSTGDDTVQLSLYANDGGPLSLATAQMGTGSTFVFTLPPGAKTHITTLGQGYQPGTSLGTPGSLAEGYAVLQFLSGTGTGSATYTLSDPTEGAVTSVAVLPATPAFAFTTPVNYFSGFALVGMGPAGVTVNLKVSDLGGTVVDAASLLVGPDEHTSFNVFDEFTDLPTDFDGTVTITGSEPFAALSIGVTANTTPTKYELYSLPSISYNPLATGYTGTFSIVAGPNTGTGTLAISGIAPFGTQTYSAMASITYMGTTNSEQIVLSSPSYAGVTNETGTWSLYASDCSATTPLAPWLGGWCLNFNVQPGGGISGVISGCATNGDVATLEESGQKTDTDSRAGTLLKWRR
ncbi:MAG: hypothetical protein ABSB67_15825 [Bryobacteraceae bacterium]|jgi:hypothetical protein